MSKQVQRVVCVYGGRFQPMHMGHFDVYQRLIKQFPVDDVFIATMLGSKQRISQAVGDYSQDPFTFPEKKAIMVRMFGIPAEKIIDTQPMYPNPEDLGIDPETTAVVIVISDKDSDRINNYKNLLRYSDYSKNLQPVSSGTMYFIQAPLMRDGMSASGLRASMIDSTKDDAKEAFVEYFGKFDKNVFTMMYNRIKHGR